VEKGEQKERFVFIQNKMMQHEQKHPHEINQRKIYSSDVETPKTLLYAKCTHYTAVV